MATSEQLSTQSTADRQIRLFSPELHIVNIGQHLARPVVRVIPWKENTKGYLPHPWHYKSQGLTTAAIVQWRRKRYFDTLLALARFLTVEPHLRLYLWGTLDRWVVPDTQALRAPTCWGRQTQSRYAPCVPAKASHWGVNVLKRW